MRIMWLGAQSASEKETGPVWEKIRREAKRATLSKSFQPDRAVLLSLIAVLSVRKPDFLLSWWMCSGSLVVFHHSPPYGLLHIDHFSTITINEKQSRLHTHRLVLSTTNSFLFFCSQFLPNAHPTPC
ncbi:hypothetical protein PHSY_005161 [Pseudozyma hubeiensis SY62]|uniref:Uncharacterized protein n=1 Tax=Pseudozyma hubeiensis (strain SY62) TaxID=1305764 RepID=R9PHI4_PSEHS|nr:hypothetical protein PHSY_005161 [Pseudozyma hubeiensis SY62]GAC97575.1 hypothetical protein PHSY_005161 [Pseudozyma hubeiensis SY62]